MTWPFFVPHKINIFPSSPSAQTNGCVHDVKVFEAVTAKLESIPGLGDRVQLFLMGDPTPLSPEEVRLITPVVCVLLRCRCFACVWPEAAGLRKHLFLGLFYDVCCLEGKSFLLPAALMAAKIPGVVSWSNRADIPLFAEAKHAPRHEDTRWRLLVVYMVDVSSWRVDL